MSTSFLTFYVGVSAASPSLLLFPPPFGSFARRRTVNSTAACMTWLGIDLRDSFAVNYFFALIRKVLFLSLFSALKILFVLSKDKPSGLGVHSD